MDPVVAKQCARAKPFALKGASVRCDWRAQPRPSGGAGFLKSHRPLGSMDSFLWPFEAFAARFASNHAFAAHLTRHYQPSAPPPGPRSRRLKRALRLSPGYFYLWAFVSSSSLFIWSHPLSGHIPTTPTPRHPDPELFEFFATQPRQQTRLPIHSPNPSRRSQALTHPGKVFTRSVWPPTPAPTLISPLSRAPPPRLASCFSRRA